MALTFTGSIHAAQAAARTSRPSLGRDRLQHRVGVVDGVMYMMSDIVIRSRRGASWR
jgi:hypothetical protein